ncbi:hypothetical protein [Alteromonas macleodii]|uniref:Uncharacterized protein n=1 Tax=Alteromonas macleodii (strain English Channel 673) TaxID=1004788 RepID=A0AB32ZUJ1_ALTME|nr:hypothetical protein [Alteromonas macleodii]AFT73211.1 hypothetical protein AMEC673_02550 [Alteromonas macleodii str. 'English Channel 673']MBL3809283.1 hypothetical protein [Alteromonas macleodii]MBL3882820.1 hypothetical protein [Alteromonas macleodii]
MEVDNIKLYIDGRWELTELNVLTRVYIQLYGLIYSLDVADDYLDNEIQYIFGKYPWRGGFSAVNFYQNLFAKMPREYKPTIKSIQYASPGFIELSQIVEVAKDVAQIVGYVSAALLAGNKTYSIIHKGMSERKLMRLNLRSEDNELAVLKILASVYRRARDLAKLQNKQKLDLQRAHIERSSNSKNQHDS